MADQWMSLYVAYSIVWAGVFVYLIYLFLKQKALFRDMKNLKEEVGKHVK